jgi:hypothetical protein
MDTTITITGKVVKATSPEGVTATMPIDQFVQKLHPPIMNCGGLVLPHGVHLYFSTASTTIFFWELPPAVHLVRWISADSKVPYRMGGAKVLYEDRRLAMPYVVIVAVFIRDPSGRLVLSGKNEAYFRTAPLEDADDELLFPALLNISKFPGKVAAKMPLTWICTQFLDMQKLAAESDFNRRVRQSLKALRSTMLEAGFNYSSEHHELTSYWSVSARKIPDVADLDRWEQLSREDPLFALKVPWLRATVGRRPMTVQKLVDRIETQLGVKDTTPDTSDSLARIIFEATPNGDTA